MWDVLHLGWDLAVALSNRGSDSLWSGGFGAVVLDLEICMTCIISYDLLHFRVVDLVTICTLDTTSRFMILEMAIISSLLSFFSTSYSDRISLAMSSSKTDLIALTFKDSSRHLHSIPITLLNLNPFWNTIDKDIYFFIIKA